MELERPCWLLPEVCRELALLPVPPAAAVASATEPPAKGQTVKVARGDSLWRISRSMFGAGRLYTQIYEANAKQIRDRARIYPGQVLVVPKS